MIPVSIVTGFLGAGKTTLIRGILRDPAFARTAVIVNEFGEIGLDHDLIASGNETFLALTTGCLCCAVRSDLIETLLELRDRAGGLFDPVLIETSGLADPAPILHALMTDRTVCATHVIDTMVTVVDPVHGEATLDRYPEARRQVALADRLVFSKTDLVSPGDSLLERIDSLNPVAPRSLGCDTRPEWLFAGADPMARAVRLAAPLDRPELSPFVQARHTDGIETASLRRVRDEVSGLDDIPRSMPATLEAGKLGSRAAKVGFDWPDAEGLFAKIAEEVEELRAEVDAAGVSEEARRRTEEEFGDLLFTAINLARHLKIDPESALRAANAKFRARFRAMEASAGGFDALASHTPDELEALWEQAKRETA